MAIEHSKSEASAAQQPKATAATSSPADAAPASARTARRCWYGNWWLLWVYRVAAAALLLTAGYFAAYQLFFVQLPLEDYAKKLEGGAPEQFRYDDVVYFDGRRLTPGDEFVMQYGSVRVLDSAEGKGIELFVRIDELPEGVDEGATIGTLHVESRVRDSIVESADVALKATTLQRHTVPWKTEAGKRNALSIQYIAAEGGPSPAHIVLSTNVVGVTYWGRILLFTLPGLAAVFLLTFAQGFRNLRLLGVIGIALLIMIVLHSGAFISNEFFEKTESSILSTYGDAWTWFAEGEWKPEQYRSTGYMIVPAATFLIEGLDASKDRHFMLSVLPTPRYLMFAWFACALPLLVTAIYTWINRAVAVIYAVLAASFFPFIIDLYNICDDAYAIPLFTVFLSAFVTYAYGGRFKGAPRRRAIGAITVMAATFFVMMTAKVTAAFLLILVPLGLWLQANREKGRWIQFGPAALAVLMLAAFIGGRHVAKIGERYVQPGYPWADSTVMEIVWAANGLYDEHSAFWFTKRGSTRTDRIVEQTGLPDTAMIRHSQAATEQVYRPQLINALRERPGFFLSTAMFRTYANGLSFFNYRYGGSGRWDKWEKDGRGQKVEISGEQVYLLKHERQLIRKGKMWKVTILVLWAKLIQFEMSFALDIILLFMALFGIFLLRRWDMGVLLLGCWGAKFVFNNWVHALVRYMNWTHVGLLLGLAVMLYCLWLAMGIIAKRSFQRHALMDLRRT